MSFLATFNIDDTEYKILRCHIGMTQAINDNGMASQRPSGGGKIDLELESNSNVDLYAWMASPNKKKNGIITFYRNDAMSRFKKLEFTDALCISYDEDFCHDGTDPLITRISISAREVKYEDVPVSNNWAVQ